MDNQTRNGKELLFAHVVLFRCPGSGDPIAAAFASNMKNIEEVDSHSFSVRCICGWFGVLAGVQRVGHWIQEWAWQ